MAIKLKDFQKRWLPKINDVLENEIIPDTDQETLAQSMSYSVNAGGKRLRPLFSLAVLTSLGQSIDHDILKACCALELMHTYSLIHDDLPAMDNDELRRGKPTNHVVYGAGMATLAGDGLQPLAFQWLVDNNLPSAIKSELVLELAKAAGPHGMVAGQADDIHFEGTKLTLSGLQKLDRNKTGALIRYAINAGLIIADVPSTQRKDLLKFAEAYGVAFQIYDDILDVVGTEQQIGKPVHQDATKNTYPNLLGLDKSYAVLQTIVNSARQSLKSASETLSSDLSLLADFCNYFEFKDEK
ncbi:polyprenyl synthetase family protein [Lentilactobacillus kisonensis]|uniref:Farnesyl diphosphate synthase n=1 Tax=Lentilactobacillus kisonensis F0435 TaxID=797516 RepID=H1LGE7_9LACO|nr:farnesyl diphosphate synthase [Lentilactobacillus kisonensis]EHO51159.1 putative geranyltranstransferase [Lentilactobacillus kisonensis F0435]